MPPRYFTDYLTLLKLKDGWRIAVDIDLAKFFDTVDHDVLMTLLGRMVADKRLLALIGRYLREGRWQIMIHGESYKPIVAEAAKKSADKVFNRICVTHLLMDDSRPNRVAGAVGFKCHEDWGTTPAVLRSALTVADEIEADVVCGLLRSAGLACAASKPRPPPW